METAEAIIFDALQEIGEQASEQPIQTVDFQTGRRYLNRMMNTVPFVGLGFTKITEPSEFVTIPDAAIEGVMFNLAKRLLSTYDIPLTSELSLSAREGMNEIRRLTVKVKPTAFPCTLPIGRGNERYNSFANQHFYSCPADEVLTEQGGSILTETNTNG
jgi:hypothetical protein